MRAYEDVVSKQQRKVYTYARYLLNHPEEAEDVTQEVFLKLWHHWSEIEIHSVRAWLLRVTRNACFDLLRKRRSRLRVVEPDTDPKVLERAPASTSGPEREAARADLRRHLLDALARLAEPYRSVLVLREIQQLPYREIGEILDLPLNTVKVYIHRGRRRLRQELAVRYDDATIA